MRILQKVATIWCIDFVRSAEAGQYKMPLGIAREEDNEETNRIIVDSSNDNVASGGVCCFYGYRKLWNIVGCRCFGIGRGRCIGIFGYDGILRNR